MLTNGQKKNARGFTSSNGDPHFFGYCYYCNAKVSANVVTLCRVCEQDEQKKKSLRGTTPDQTYVGIDASTDCTVVTILTKVTMNGVECIITKYKYWMNALVNTSIHLVRTRKYRSIPVEPNR